MHMTAQEWVDAVGWRMPPDECADHHPALYNGASGRRTDRPFSRLEATEQGTSAAGNTLCTRLYTGHYVGPYGYDWCRLPTDNRGW